MRMKNSPNETMKCLRRIWSAVKQSFNWDEDNRIDKHYRNKNDNNVCVHATVVCPHCKKENIELAVKHHRECYSCNEPILIVGDGSTIVSNVYGDVWRIQAEGQGQFKLTEREIKGLNELANGDIKV